MVPTSTWEVDGTEVASGLQYVSAAAHNVHISLPYFKCCIDRDYNGRGQRSLGLYNKLHITHAVMGGIGR